MPEFPKRTLGQKLSAIVSIKSENDLKVSVKVNRAVKVELSRLFM